MTHPKHLLRELKIPARHSLSQSFLASGAWAQKTVRALLEEKSLSEIWEIGPGLGALTEVLVLESGLPIRVFEYDRKLVEYLRKQFPNVEIYEGDFLSSDLSAISAGQKQIGVISNLPYHISSPIFFKLLEDRDRFPRLVLTFQREFAERLLAKPRTKAYGALSVLAQVCFEISGIGVLPAGAFYPRPEVASQALRFEPKRVSPEIFQKLRFLVRQAFKHRRKTLLNNLKTFLPAINANELGQRFGISVVARPEEISKETYVQLAEDYGDSLPNIMLGVK